jgi:hypothetical protein
MQQPDPPQQSNRQQLAERGQQQIVQMMRSGKQLLDLYSQLQPTAEAQQQLATLQQQYLTAAADVQAILQQCQALQQQEQAAAAAGEFRAPSFVMVCNMPVVVGDVRMVLNAGRVW